jgi:hypothetical protein
MKRFEVAADVRFIVFGEDNSDAIEAVASSLDSHDIAHVSHVVGYQVMHVRQLEGEGSDAVPRTTR